MCHCDRKIIFMVFYYSDVDSDDKHKYSGKIMMIIAKPNSARPSRSRFLQVAKNILESFVE